MSISLLVLGLVAFGTVTLLARYYPQETGEVLGTTIGETVKTIGVLTWDTVIALSDSLGSGLQSFAATKSWSDGQRKWIGFIFSLELTYWLLRATSPRVGFSPSRGLSLELKTPFGGGAEFETGGIRTKVIRRERAPSGRVTRIIEEETIKEPITHEEELQAEHRVEAEFERSNEALREALQTPITVARKASREMKSVIKVQPSRERPRPKIEEPVVIQKAIQEPVLIEVAHIERPLIKVPTKEETREIIRRTKEYEQERSHSYIEKLLNTPIEVRW